MATFVVRILGCVLPAGYQAYYRIKSATFIMPADKVNALGEVQRTGLRFCFAAVAGNQVVEAQDVQLVVGNLAIQRFEDRP